MAKLKETGSETGTRARMKRYAIIVTATGGFAGFFPVAPGTMGSLVGVAIVWAYRDVPFTVQLLLCLALAGVGVWASDRACHLFGVPDSSHIVIDEIVGLMITMLSIPVTPYWLIWGFLIFRFFDIVKVPPANYFDSKVKNGWGVMMDDILAGIYGNILLHLMLRAQL